MEQQIITSADVGDATSLLVVPRRRSEIFSQTTLDSCGLRPNMWVAKDEADGSAIVGILTACDLDGLVEITLVKPDGSNRMMLDENDKAVPYKVTTRIDSIRQAWVEEVPARRCDDVDRLARLGYKSKGGAQ
jgi:hypothetical protein